MPNALVSRWKNENTKPQGQHVSHIARCAPGAYPWGDARALSTSNNNILLPSNREKQPVMPYALDVYAFMVLCIHSPHEEQLPLLASCSAGSIGAPLEAGC